MSSSSGTRSAKATRSLPLDPTRARPPAALVIAAKSLAMRDNYHNVFYVATDFLIAVAAAAAAAIWGHPIGYVLAVIVIGTRMRALANLMHEASHHKLFLDRRLNAIGGWICAVPIVESLSTYTRDHMTHHRALWRSDIDPDARLYRLTDTEYAASDRMSHRMFLLRHVALAILMVQPVRRIAGDPRLASRTAIVITIGAASWLLGPGVGFSVTMFWAVPWLTAYQVIAYWAELGEHGGLRPRGWSWGSRNWTAAPLTLAIIGQHSADPYHLAHHWFPAVPHYRLAELDRTCVRLWPEYAEQGCCEGFFRDRGRRDNHTEAPRPSVLTDVWTGGQPRPDRVASA